MPFLDVNLDDFRSAVIWCQKFNVALDMPNSAANFTEFIRTWSFKQGKEAVLKQ